MAIRSKIKTIKITNEHWVLVLLTVSPPLIAYIYLDWRAALAAFLITQTVLGIVKERYN